MVTVPNLVTVEDYEDAIRRLRERAPDMLDVGLRWRQRAIEHLHRKLDGYFRDRPTVYSEQQAMAIIKGIAHNLEDASTALRWAAERFRKRGDPEGASKTVQAAKRAHEQALELIGSD